MFELILVVLSFIGGCVATFFFARANKTRFLGWITSDKESLLQMIQAEIKAEVEKGKAKLKSKL